MIAPSCCQEHECTWQKERSTITCDTPCLTSFKPDCEHYERVVAVQVLDRFLEAKDKVDSGTAANQEDQENHCIDAFHALTSVRALLASGLQSGVPSFDPCAGMVELIISSLRQC